MYMAFSLDLFPKTNIPNETARIDIDIDSLSETHSHVFFMRATVKYISYSHKKEIAERVELCG